MSTITTGGTRVASNNSLAGTVVVIDKTDRSMWNAAGKGDLYDSRLSATDWNYGAFNGSVMVKWDDDSYSLESMESLTVVKWNNPRPAAVYGPYKYSAPRQY